MYRSHALYSAHLVLGLLGLFFWGCDEGEGGAPSLPPPPPEVPLVDAGSFGDGPLDAEQCARPFLWRLRADEAPPSEVRLAGDFESPPWSASIVLQDQGDGTLRTEVLLSPGAHQYKFVVDGEWRNDPENGATAEDGMGGINSLIEHRCPFDGECLLDSDCPEETPFCRAFLCVANDEPVPCGGPCPEGSSCDEEAGRCVESTPECAEMADCDAPFICREGRCEPECVEDSGCTDGDRCVELSCVTPECEDDSSCDALEESCLNFTCAPRPCQEQLFIFDPRGTEWAGQRLDTVHVAGSFNGWPGTAAGDAWVMSPLEDGRWYTRQRVENGEWEYKFVLSQGGMVEWITDPGNPIVTTDGDGNENSLLSVNCDDAPVGPGSCGDLSTFQWEDAVMYFALVDRFYDSDGLVDLVPGATGGDATQGSSGQYYGGDLDGLREKLPYLERLGVSALWLSAPYDNRDTAGAAIDPGQDPNNYSGYHGYWPKPENIDYRDPENPQPVPLVEPRIGDAAALDALVEGSHERGIRVLFDYVMNHVDLESGLYEAHPEWFARRDGRFALCGPDNLWDDDYWGMRCAFTDYLPPFDFDNDEARAWSVADAIWWAKRFNIDGYRLDAIKHVPLSWLEDLRQALNREFEEPDGGRFYLVGETFSYDDPGLLRRFINPDTLLDGQFDFPMKARLCEGLFRPEKSLEDFSNWLRGNDSFYGPGSLMTTWIGNHDIPRAIHYASGQIGNCREGSSPQNGWIPMSYPQPAERAPYERLGLAFVVMMTNPGVPLYYYGDEVGLAGGGDPDNRRAMPWDDASLNDGQLALRALVERLGTLRAENKVLARGRRLVRSASRDTWVYTMLGCGAGSPPITVAINRADDARSVEVPAGAYDELLSETSMMGGEIELPPRSAIVLRPAAAE
ncbi:MAG: alpha-amylase family glycosyl hydrolase [Myxococcota bacterium]|nr:alpha-amylase family glycosyl hydrolase [Myxococcota bacterium]